MAEEELQVLTEIELSPTRSVVLSTSNNGYILLNEKIATPGFTGYTHKGFSLKADDIPAFINAVRDVASSMDPGEYRFQLSKKKELVVYRPGENQVDMRHYSKTDDYRGYLKRGLRVVSSNAIKITDALSALDVTAIDSTKRFQALPESRWAKYDDFCKSCGTTKRPHLSEGLCAACYERNHSNNDLGRPNYETDKEIVARVVSRIPSDMLEIAYKIHGKRCYVCNKTKTKVGPLEIYFADSDETNTSADNVYPICPKCKTLI